MENTNTATAASKSSVEDKQQVKRDEWSEVAVTSLLEAYEAKWVLRNRAKLTGQDWVEVARYVSSATPRAPKTQTQCKNKIESMKKRYRSESASAGGVSSIGSTWPLYQRIHLLLTGGHKHNTNNTDIHQTVPPIDSNSTPLETPSPVQFPAAQNQNGPSPLLPKEEDRAKMTQSDHARHEKTMTSDSTSTSTNPAFHVPRGNKLRPSSSNTRTRKKRKRNGMQSCGIIIAKSIRWLGEAVIRTEETRMETMRELEKLQAETEIRRGEMELKRTQIIANTQLEIARLMSGKCAQGCGTSTRRFNLDRVETKGRL